MYEHFKHTHPSSGPQLHPIASVCFHYIGHLTASPGNLLSYSLESCKVESLSSQLHTEQNLHQNKTLQKMQDHSKSQNTYIVAFNCVP